MSLEGTVAQQNERYDLIVRRFRAYTSKKGDKLSEGSAHPGVRMALILMCSGVVVIGM